jgi:hypothetical protein
VIHASVDNAHVQAGIRALMCASVWGSVGLGHGTLGTGTAVARRVAKREAHHCEIDGKQGAEKQSSKHGRSLRSAEGCKSVPAGEFGHIDGPPLVMVEVEQIDAGEEGDRHRLRSESPVIRIGPELEACQQQADARCG